MLYTACVLFLCICLPIYLVVAYFMCAHAVVSARLVDRGTSQPVVSMSSPGEMDGERMRAMLIEFADASKNLTKEDAEVSDKLCEVAKAFLKERAKEFVKAHQGRPILMSYQSDGTPTLAKRTHTAKRSSGQLVVRKAGRGIELLLQKVFLKTITPTGDHLVSCFFRDPRPLDNGKGTCSCFTAACECFPLLQTLGHNGTCVTHYCCDRAVLELGQGPAAAPQLVPGGCLPD